MTQGDYVSDAIDSRFLGERLQQRRRRENLTLDQVSRKTGISIATLSRVERGDARAIKASTLVLLLRWLELPVESVVNVEVGREVPTAYGSSQSVPEIVEIHLRADKKLDEKTASALAKLFRAAYEELSGE